MKAVWAGIALLLVAGCGGHATPKDQALPRSDYRSLVRENVPRFAGQSDQQLDGLGKSLCVVLKDNEWIAVIKRLTQAGLSGGDAGQITNYATATFCPELKKKLPST